MRKNVERADMTLLEIKRRHLSDIDVDEEIPLYAMFTAILLPDYYRSSTTRDKTEAEIALAHTFLAIQAYRDRYGSYPALLKELKTKLGWKLPEDPFSGKDLKYITVKSGYKLYSIGTNMKDDGGVGNSDDPTKSADIVWDIKN